MILPGVIIAPAALLGTPTTAAPPRPAMVPSQLLPVQQALAASAMLPVASQHQAIGSGATGTAQTARPFAPTVRAVAPGQAGAAGQAVTGSRKALVGMDVWQLASDVMAAGGTATTAAAVTTAAQQVVQSKQTAVFTCR